MKKILLLMVIGITVQNYAFSQRFPPLKGMSYIIGLTWNNWQNYPDVVKVNAIGNRGFDFGAVKRINIIKGNLGFNIGLGISNINIHSNVNPWQFIDSSGAVNPRSLMKTEDYKKNKLSLTYAEIPLELAFRTNSDSNMKSFKIGVGFRIGYIIDAHTKLKQADMYRIDKTKMFENINPLRYGVTARVGYSRYSLYFRYDLTSTFKKDKVPDYNVYSIGLVLTEL